MLIAGILYYDYNKQELLRFNEYLNMIVRDKNYRRKQEAKHYKKRLKTAIALGRFDEKKLPNGEVDYVATYPGKYRAWRIKSFSTMNDYELKEIEKNQYKRWKFQLKNNSMVGTMDPWAKRHCRRTRRHFQKMVDYKLPDKKWLVRAQVIDPRDIV